jgi:hypothetical protein
MSFASTILCVASQWQFIVVYFVIDSVRKLSDTLYYVILISQMLLKGIKYQLPMTDWAKKHRSASSMSLKSIQLYWLITNVSVLNNTKLTNSMEQSRSWGVNNRSAS